MMLQRLSSMLLLVVIPSIALGQEGAKPEKRSRANQANFVAQLEKKIASAEPSDEQKAKIKAISDEYGPKLAELAKKFNEGMPEEIRKQLTSARKELTASGTKGKKLSEAMAGKVTLSDEQKKLHDETNAAREKLQREIVTKVAEILTPEQIAKAGIKVPKTKKADKKSAV